MDLLKYSGLVSIIITWLYVVFPFAKQSPDIRKQSISHITSSDNLRVVTFGLITGALFQFVFLFYLTTSKLVEFTPVSTFLYLTTIMATISVALCPLTANPKVHNFSVKYFFIVYPIVIALFGLNTQIINLLFTYLSIFLSFAYFAVMFLIHRKYGISNALAEIWAFFVISVWIISLTVVL